MSDAVRFALREPPVDDAQDFAPPREAGGDADLSAGLVGRFEQYSLVSARRSDARGFQPARAAADDDEGFQRPVAARDDMRHREFAAGRRIVHAHRLAGIDAVDAIAHADAGSYLVLAALIDLRHDVRVGQMRARHADQIELAGFDGVPRGGDVLDARGVEGRRSWSRL